MLYRQKHNTFIRQYDNVGYIFNNSFGDRVVDAAGALFLSVLSRKSQNIDEVTMKISQSFPSVDTSAIKKDAQEFYAMLEIGGFIISGESETEIDKKDAYFSYFSVENKQMKKAFLPQVKRVQKSTDEHFRDNPQIVSLQIELSSRCNERCVHCYIPHENKINDMEPALFYDVLDQCNDMGILFLNLSGGEPMMHKNFCDFLRKIKGYDFSIQILSNLTLLNDEIISELKANRCCSLQVSLYSMDPEIHDSITKLPGSFYKTRDAILNLIENDIQIRISCPTMKQNKNCYIDVLNWAQEHKVSALTDLMMMARYDHTKDNLDNRLSLDEVNTILEDIIRYDENYKREITSIDFDDHAKHDRRNDAVCSVGIASLCMDADGSCYPCAGWQEYKLGNVKETSLREIWMESPKIKYLRSLRISDFPKCVTCKDIAFCSLCMVRNANESPNGDPLKINEHFCKIAALNRKIVLEWKEESA
jgi:radical SAM protein with 4Fe4S-binding SPASM domain